MNKKLKTIIVEDFEDYQPQILAKLEPFAPVIPMFDKTYPAIEERYVEGKTTIRSNQRIREEFIHVKEALENRVSNFDLVICLGKLPFLALTGLSNVNKFRSSFVKKNSSWIFPTYSTSTLVKQFPLLIIAKFDLNKAKNFDGKIPNYQTFVVRNLPDLYFVENELCKNPKPISCDIETKEGFITEIGFGVSPTKAFVIPFYLRETRANFWKTLETEIKVWKVVEKILKQNPIIGQNFSYDMKYLWRTGIKEINYRNDTMLLQHTLNIEMPKNLGFLASLYTNRSPWKDMRTSTLKED